MPRIFNNDGTFEDVEHINGYLFDGPDIYVEPRTTPLCRVPKMVAGNKPVDGSHLILSEEERDKIVKKYPASEKFFMPCIGGREFLHNEKRFCIWLVNATPDEVKKFPPIYERVKKVAAFRKKSSSAKTCSDSEIPHLFQRIVQPTGKYLIIPQLSSENRKYIPIGFLPPEVVTLDPNLMIPNADLRHFAILTSSVHMIWMRTVCGRLENRYRYSEKIVYNNFAWKRITIKDYLNLIESAQKILDARKNYPNASLADLYDEITMPKDLRAAHRENDKIVMKIYGYNESMTEQEIAIDLLQTYASLKYYDEHRAEFQDEDDEDGEDCE